VTEGNAIKSITGLRKFKPYPAYKDSGVEWLREIPSEWHTLKLKRICRFADGDSLVTDSRLDGDIEVYGSNGPVGTHGRSGVKRWVLGSVTEKVVRHSGDPVLVVRGA